MAFVLRANQMHLFFCSLSVNDFVVFSVKLRTQRTALRSPYEKKNDDELNMIFCVCTCNGCALIWFFCTLNARCTRAFTQTNKQTLTDTETQTQSKCFEWILRLLYHRFFSAVEQWETTASVADDTRVLYDCCSIRWANSVKRISFCFFFCSLSV